MHLRGSGRMMPPRQAAPNVAAAIPPRPAGDTAGIPPPPSV
ncbi:hypothetical protein HMPREF1546_03145 [Oscillibacter sp. KLE 1745]|nr:hypothetical protein HMPREF1546_03145 [Oscillibacter sp. KLE 1745]